MPAVGRPSEHVILLRHAYAVTKTRSVENDVGRPLDSVGHETSLRLVGALLEQTAVSRIVSSPFLRCRQTVEPLAAALGIGIDEDEGLVPSAPATVVEELLRLLPEGSVACTHGEVIRRLLGPDVDCDKGGFWLVERHDGVLRPVAYTPPPAVR